MTVPVQTSDPAADLSRRIWITRGCRFAAQKRLNSRHVWSTWATAVLSVYIIAASVFAQFLPQSALSQSVLNAGLIVASVLVLVLSIIEGGRGYQLRAERLHRCAVDLGKLESRLVVLQSIPPGTLRNSQIARLVRRYVEAIEACPDNHETLDYDSFRAQHPEDFAMSWGSRSRIWFVRQLHTVGPYALAIAAPPTLVYVLSSLFAGPKP